MANWRRFAVIRKVQSSSSLSEAEIPVDDDELLLPKTKGTSKPLTTTRTESPTKPEPQVTFSTIQFRRYNRVVGDNPSCDYPLALGWNFTESEPLSVEDFDEEYHSDPDYTSAKYIEPMNVEERKHLLYLAGYTNDLLRHEERRRRIQILTEWCRHGHTEPWLMYCFPENSNILVQRYLCERPTGH